MRSAGEADNCGAGYVVPDADGVPTRRMDDLDLAACDLICLDVEGSELDALQGAERTIRTFRPTISFEDKKLPHMGLFNRKPLDVQRWLHPFGYRVVAQVHRDVVMACD